MSIQLCKNCPTLIIFTNMQQCRHCQALKPLLSDFLAGTDKERGFHIMQIDANDADGRLKMQKFQISGVPTLLMYDTKNDELFHYQGARTKDALSDAMFKIKRNKSHGFATWEHTPRKIKTAYRRLK